jgi:phage tail-like protein
MSIDLIPGRQGSLPSEARTTTLSAAVFKIECDFGGTAVFSELAGITSELEVAEYMEAGEKGPMFGRFVGKAKPPTVTLKRAMSTGPDTHWIWAWHAAAREGNVTAYANTTLSLCPAGDPEHPLKSYMMTNAIPTKVEIAGMKAGATEVVMQTVTLQCDELAEAP